MVGGPEPGDRCASLCMGDSGHPHDRPQAPCVGRTEARSAQAAVPIPGVEETARARPPCSKT